MGARPSTEVKSWTHNRQQREKEQRRLQIRLGPDAALGLGSTSSVHGSGVEPLGEIRLAAIGELCLWRRQPDELRPGRLEVLEGGAEVLEGPWRRRQAACGRAHRWGGVAPSSQA